MWHGMVIQKQTMMHKVNFTLSTSGRHPIEDEEQPFS